MSQNSQENICAGVSYFMQLEPAKIRKMLNKVAGWNISQHYRKYLCRSLIFEVAAATGAIFPFLIKLQAEKYLQIHNKTSFVYGQIESWTFY